MDPDRRRILMMGSIIMLGVVLIIFDVSLDVLLTLTTVTGLLFLIIGGSLRNARPKGSRVPEEAPGLVSIGPPVTDMNKQKQPSLVQRLRGGFRNIAASIRWQPSPEAKKVTEVKKIDEMLDMLIAGNSVPSPILSRRKIAETIETTPKANTDIDPIKELSNAKLEDDLLTPESPPSDAQEIKTEDHVLSPEPDTAGNPVVTGTPPDKVEKMSQNQDPDIEDLTDLEELDFNNITLDDSDIDGEELTMYPSSGGTGAISTGSTPAKREVMVALPPTGPNNPEISKNPSSEKGDAREKSLFGIGLNGGDDLLLALRSEVSQVKKPKDMSLFREMKDTTVTTQELRNDLEKISLLLTSKNSKPRGGGIPSRNHQNSTSR